MAGMRPEDVYGLTGASQPRLDPSGRTVAYVVWSVDRDENTYRSSIWIVPLDGSAPPRRLTHGLRDGSHTWSPDGTRIAFVSKADKDATAQVCVVPVASGDIARLTDLHEDVTDLAWSPDATQIAFASRVRDEAYAEENDALRTPRRITRLGYKHDNVGWTFDRPQQLFVVTADGGTPPRQLTGGEVDCAAPAWSPDGERLVYVSAAGDDWDIDLVSDLFVLPLAGGEPECVTGHDGSASAPAWSADGTRIAFRWTPDLHDFPRHTRIAVLDAASGERRLLAEELDRNCGPYPELAGTVWDGNRIVFGVEDRGRTHVYAVAADGSSPAELLVGGEISVSGYDAAAGTVVHTAARGDTLHELYHGERRLTDLGAAFVAGRDLVPPERFTAVSADGAEVDAWLVRPAGFDPARRYPVLLSIHGGPFTQYPVAFFDEFQVLAGAGYAVLYANPRGSSGSTEDWGRAIRGTAVGGSGWGTVDYEDLMAVADEGLRRFDFLDGERLGVLGGSYGGYMTSWIVSHTNRFKAACSERAVNQLLSAFGSSDLFWAFAYHFGAFPWDDLGPWLDQSPAQYAQAIETPLLIVHADNDLRCDVEQAEHLFISLRLQRKPVELVRFPAEGHELSRSGSPAHRVQRFELLLEWFGRHLK